MNVGVAADDGVAAEDGVAEAMATAWDLHGAYHLILIVASVSRLQETAQNVLEAA